MPRRVAQTMMQCLRFIDMTLFTKENKILLKILRQDKRYTAKHSVKEFLGDRL